MHRTICLAVLSVALIAAAANSPVEAGSGALAARLRASGRSVPTLPCLAAQPRMRYTAAGLAALPSLNQRHLLGKVAHIVVLAVVCSVWALHKMSGHTLAGTALLYASLANPKTT